MKRKPTNLKALAGRPKKIAKAPERALLELKQLHGASGLKLSTEDAGMGHAQIAEWARIAKGIVPVWVKIGGPNARNDIKEMIPLEVDGLIAPMVESAYGLENFLSSLHDFTTPLQFKRLKKSINIESRVALTQLDEILEYCGVDGIDEVTIGCSDLSSSMGVSRNDPDFRKLVQKTVKRIRDCGVPVSIGGGICPANIDEILEEAQPLRFNTRLLAFPCDGRPSFRAAVESALQFEIMMLAYDLKQGYISLDEERYRVSEIMKRL
ncbi:MAG: hypothetical protein G3M78_13010 [Candidatus Nitrohelix vancouverensis]|uniref:HpcH/HpaI aldolase/citrate lyase domain-containing protein n=1 Tax=Candidatus Nitrohelix vancouverensis TaxID=2705534 RepID=A0A7T0C4F4_9BACT|nr:MAG: hypothetical protein G3M78_13010 [Candidatus Nitrohelix vancouverensis]